MEAYAENLDRTYGDRFSLLYLSGDGSSPETLGRWKQRLKDENRFHSIAYYGGSMPNLYDWTMQCTRAAEADKLRWFLRDFAAWIAENFEPPKSNEGGGDELPH